MKKVAYFFLVLVASIGLTACSGKEEPSANPPDKSGSNEQNPIYQNEAFKDVVVKKTDDKFVVTGKARAFEGVFQYQLYDGNKVLQEDRYQTAGAPAWGDFEISFAKDLVSGNDARLELFVYSAKDGSKINILEIPIK